MCVTARRQYQADTSAVAAASEFGGALVVATLNASGWALADDVQLLLKEMVRSAVDDEATSIVVRVDLHYDRIDIKVIDDRGAEGDPAEPRPSDHADAVVPAAWRGSTVTDTGRVVSWAQLPCSPRHTTRMSCTRRPDEPTH
jgi:hypothetical protein